MLGLKKKSRSGAAGLLGAAFALARGARLAFFGSSSLRPALVGHRCSGFFDSGVDFEFYIFGLVS
jgi:hypothetical protein